MDAIWIVAIAVVGLVLLSVIVAVVHDIRRPSLDLTNLHVLVTGGSSGLGKELAREVRRLGANVTILARNQDRLDAAREELLSEVSARNVSITVGKPWIETMSVDVSKDYGRLSDAIHDLIERRGPIDVLINCAGKSVPGRFIEQDAKVCEETMQANFMSAVYMTRAVLPHRPKRVCFISSNAGLIGVYGYTAYCASKYALHGFAEALAMELRGTETKITIAVPADMDTPGYKEENKTKPEETFAISSSSMCDTTKVAKAIVRDVRLGQFLCCSCLDGWFLSVVNSGCMPVSSWTRTLCEIWLTGAIRLFAIFTLWQMSCTIEACAAKRQKSSETDPEGTASNGIRATERDKAAKEE